MHVSGPELGRERWEITAESMVGVPTVSSPEPTARVIPRHFPALDGLRGLAVLSVFFYHYGGGKHSGNAVARGIGFLCSLGWTGVTLFFLLSGFLITGLLWDAKGEAHWLRNFYIRRALRIWPLYYGTLLALLIWPLFDRRYHFYRVAGVVAIHAAFLQNVPRFNWRWLQVPVPFWLEHYWTLAVEEQFYLLWPMLLLLARTRRQALLLCVATIMFSIGFGYYNLSLALPVALWHSLPVHAGELGLGGGLALSYRGDHWPEVKRWMQILGLVGAVVFLGGMVLLPYWGGTVVFEHTWGLLAVSLAFGGLLSSVLDGGAIARMGSRLWLRWLGGISFGAYIFHLLAVRAYNDLVHRITGEHDGQMLFDLTRMVVVAAITLTVAWVSFQFYERPFLKLKERFAARRPSRSTVASGSSDERY